MSSQPECFHAHQLAKAVPTVNLFIISFPLTIGIGLFISILALPEAAHYLGREFNRLGDVLHMALR